MNTKSNATSTNAPMVICISNLGYEVGLEPRKLYETRPDSDAAKHGQLRVVDESGEDYLFPRSHFAEIDLPRSIRKAVLAAG